MKCQVPVHRGVLCLILVAFVGLAGVYSAVVPIFEAPDETAHVDFVRFLRDEKSLPQQGQTGEAHQPPLYYLLATLASLPAPVDDFADVLRPNPNMMWLGVGQDVNFVYHTAIESFPWQGTVLAIHLMRGVSVLMGLGTVLVVYLTGREIYPRSRVIPLGAAAIVAFNPQFVFVSSVVNNDNLANLCAAMAIWMMVRMLVGHDDRLTLLGLGLSLGTGLMAKQNILVLVPLAGLVLAFSSLRQRNLRLLLEGVFIVGGAIVLMTGWWYWRNQVLYGDPFGVDAFLANRPEEGSATINDWQTLRVFLDRMHRSFWGMFGWMNVPLPAWIYRLLTALYVVVVIGLGAAWFRIPEDRARLWSAWALLASVPILYVLWVLLYGYRFGGSGWQGRYLFPAIPVVGLALATSLTNLFLKRGRIQPLVVAALGLLVTTIWALPGVINPAYLRVTHPWSELDHAKQPMDVNFGDVIQLSGYDLAVASGGAGPTVSATFYWRAVGWPTADYKVFVHLVNLDWELYGQGDGYPLDGQFTTPAWRPGDLIIDPHTVQYQKPITPGDYRIALGWYVESTGERLPVIHQGQQVGTVAETESFELQP